MRGLECAFGSSSNELPIVGNPKPTIQIGCKPKYKLSPLTIFFGAHSIIHLKISSSYPKISAYTSTQYQNNIVLYKGLEIKGL